MLKEFLSKFDKSLSVSNTSKCVVNRRELRLKFLTANGNFFLNDFGKIANKNAEKKNVKKRFFQSETKALLTQSFLDHSLKCCLPITPKSNSMIA